VIKLGSSFYLLVVSLSSQSL